MQRRGRQSLIAMAVAAVCCLSGLALIGVALASQRRPASPPVMAVSVVDPAQASSAAVAPAPERRELWQRSHMLAAQPTPNRAEKSDAADSAPPESSDRDSAPPAGSPLAAVKPVSIEIPAIDVRSVVGDVGQAANGSLEVPSGAEYNNAAWYRHSPTPGSLGPAVILGHVDSAAQGPSVFFRLGELRPGHRVTVIRADGSHAVFVVDAVHRYAKDNFPTKVVYGDIDHAGLRILTCGGAFDDAAGSYVDNIVVFASLVDADS